MAYPLSAADTSPSSEPSSSRSSFELLSASAYTSRASPVTPTPRSQTESRSAPPASTPDSTVDAAAHASVEKAENSTSSTSESEVLPGGESALL